MKLQKETFRPAQQRCGTGAAPGPAAGEARRSGAPREPAGARAQAGDPGSLSQPFPLWFLTSSRAQWLPGSGGKATHTQASAQVRGIILLSIT